MSDYSNIQLTFGVLIRDFPVRAIILHNFLNYGTQGYKKKR